MTDVHTVACTVDVHCKGTRCTSDSVVAAIFLLEGVANGWTGLIFQPTSRGAQSFEGGLI